MAKIIKSELSDTSKLVAALTEEPVPAAALAAQLGLDAGRSAIKLADLARAKKIGRTAISDPRYPSARFGYHKRKEGDIPAPALKGGKNGPVRLVVEETLEFNSASDALRWLSDRPHARWKIAK